MAFAKMKLVLGLVPISLGLLGCEQAPPKLSAEVRASEEAFADEISLRAKLITPGMSRDEVLKILGPSDGNLGRPPKWPICDEFLYVKDGEERAVAVWYQGRKVDRVNATAHSRCEIH